MKILSSIKIWTFLLLGLSGMSLQAQHSFHKDTLITIGGPLVVTFIGHSSLHFQFHGISLYIDPVSQVADYSEMPKASVILVTHEHGDHFDTTLIAKLSSSDTKLAMTQLCHNIWPMGEVVKNGDFISLRGIDIEVVPAYNIFHKRGNGKPYHEKGHGNGYILSFGGYRVYVAGDTEYIPEMKEFKSIDVAFLPVAEPFTMSIMMLDMSARTLSPKILYPYHLNRTDPDEVVKTLMGSGIDVRIRAMR